jgi:hypothetical protein
MQLNQIKMTLIGKSKNIKVNYFTHNQETDMFFIRKCYNCDTAERSYA